MIKNNQLWDLKHDQDSFSKETVKRVKYSQCGLEGTVVNITFQIFKQIFSILHKCATTIL